MGGTVIWENPSYSPDLSASTVAVATTHADNSTEGGVE
jgi:hypothetical protein